MKYFAPAYYPYFRCIADACRHSCCIGWEIDIDPVTREKYRTVEGPIGRRLAEEIIDGEPSCFRLGENERCPFLREDGLCTLILELGEDSLCDICALHPRFRNYFSDRAEIGLGLCCEAAAELILTRGGETELIPVDEDEEATFPLSPEEEALLACRAELLAICRNEDCGFAEKTERLLNAVEADLPSRAWTEWRAVYADLERLDTAWDKLLSRLGRKSAPIGSEWDIPLSHLLGYFLFRHLPGALDAEDPDAAIRARVCFAVLSAEIIRKIFAGGEQSMEALGDIARQYSAEVEYSDENLGRVLELLGE